MTDRRDPHGPDPRPMARPTRPVALDPAALEDRMGPNPSDAPPVPEPEAVADPAAERALRRAARGRRGGLAGRLFWSGLGGLLVLALGLWVGGVVAELFALAPALGWVGVALASAAIAGLAAILVGELAALARLARVDGLRRQAARAAASDAPGPAYQLVNDLARLYRGRPELAAEDVAARAGEIADGRDIVALAERRLMPALDAEAERAVSRAASRVAGLTAVLPMPALEILVVLWQNVAMIRRIAEIYGGRAGWLGSWRLLKAVAQHLLATGAVSAADDLLGPLVGGGILGQVSRRFGEAAVNAALTARVGTSAIEVCRPLAFRVRPAPKARSLVLGALKGWSGRAAGR